VLPTLPRPGSGLQTLPGTGHVLPPPAGAPDPGVFADAVARYRALERLREFRRSLYECLDARADALFELAGKTLGVVGLGGIGRAMAGLGAALATGFGRHERRIDLAFGSHLATHRLARGSPAHPLLPLASLRPRVGGCRAPPA